MSTSAFPYGGSQQLNAVITMNGFDSLTSTALADRSNFTHSAALTPIATQTNGLQDPFLSPRTSSSLTALGNRMNDTHRLSADIQPVTDFNTPPVETAFSSDPLRVTRRDRALNYIPTAKWTVMVYMAGGTLEQFGIQDFLEMAAIGSTDDVNVVVQFDRTSGFDTSYGDWTDTAYGLVQAGDIPDLNWGASVGEANMGDPNTLLNFVNWSMTHYQAENYALVMWGHGDGFSLSLDDQFQIDNSQSADSISARELNAVLSTTIDQVDLVGADACLMGTTEFAYEICNNASIFVGSQELVPGTGWNYTSVLSSLATSPTMTANQLGRSIVEYYGQHYSSPLGNDFFTKETFSAIDLSALRDSNPNSLATTLNQFASTVISFATSDDLLKLDWYRDYHTDSFGDDAAIARDYCDIGRFFSDVVNDSFLSYSLRTTAQAVLNSYSEAVIGNYSEVVGRGTGLSIYFSDKGESATQEYNGLTLSFAANTQWDNLLNWQGWQL